MCGIAGFFGNRATAPSVAQHMLAAIAQRGPDAQHAVTWDAAFRRASAEVHNALLHARLSIIDPRPEADQPMSNEAGDLWICYNGEVYGWQDDAAELARGGAAFRTRSDTEFILRAYEAWGTGCLERLRGMFAFAILDLRRRKVILARDRMGLKPLVYHHAPGRFAFGSTVRSVLPCLPADERAFDPQAIDAYLAHRYIPAPRTVLAGVRRLPNAHLLEYDLDRGTLEQRRWWTPLASKDDWVATLDQAVRLRTVADRPLGVFLSGGIDSTLIGCRLAAQGFAGVATFTAAFPGSSMDESADAARAARRFGLPNRACPVPTAIAADFDRIVADLDEPFADPSAFPMWYLARDTVDEVKVVLGGDGGYELFGGYKRYAKHARNAWRGALRLPGLGARASLEDRGSGRVLEELGMTWEDAYALRFSGLSPNQRRFLMPHYVPSPQHWRPPATVVEPGRSAAVERLIAIDLENYLPEYILRKGDLCTMAHGLELRAPLLDHRFVCSVLGMSAQQRFTREPKRVLAQACPALEELGLFDRAKRGFNPPLDRWLGEDLAARLDGLGTRLSDASGGQLEAAGVDRFVAAYRSGSRRLAEQVLQLVVLETSLAQIGALFGRMD